MKRSDHFLKTAVRAARAAGEIQMKGFGKAHRIQFKGDINLVTEVDKACEEKIQKMISREFPDHDFLMEESGAWNRSSEYKWIVDPLDGTTNYAHGYPCFCVSIGLEHKGRVVLGVVYEPNLDQLFVGVQGGGATLNGKKIRVSRIGVLQRALLATGFAYNIQKSQRTRNNMSHFENFLRTSQAVRRDGAAAVDICYVACGRFDGFWEMDLRPWDIAAASLILEEAGGTSTLFDGSALNIYTNQIVCSNGMIHPAMMDVLKRRRR